MIGELNTEQAGAVGTIEKHSRELLAPVDSILHATLIEADRFLIETHPKFGRADWRLENQVPSVTGKTGKSLMGLPAGLAHYNQRSREAVEDLTRSHRQRDQIYFRGRGFHIGAH